MDTYKIAVKIFVATDSFAASEFVPVFHRWIQSQALAGHMLIDVADYAHVPDGPGTVLVSSQANIYTDRGAGRFGLLYARKLPLEGNFSARLRQVLSDTLKATALLEREPTLAGRLKFRTDELLIRLNDRLLAPNSAGTLAAVLPDVEALANSLFGQPVTIDHKPSDQTLFEVRVKSPKSPPISALLDRLGNP
jgi:hypothetical protein